jgi:ADP-ribosylglycohydrolase
MARNIVQQPNGLYSVFSSIVDDFIIVDATIDEIVEAYIEDEREKIKWRVENELERMKKHVSFSYEDALHTIELVHGKQGDTNV